MKKWLKISLGIIGVIVLLVIIDLVVIFTFQRPLFAVKGVTDSMYKGLFYDTYVCDEFSIPQIKMKGTKFVCSEESSLNRINNQIIEYFSNDNTDYENYVFNYVDLENYVVVVGLLDNSKKEQERFKRMVVDSNLIKFVQTTKLVEEVDEYTFIRTYHILNRADSNDDKYLYLTLRQFQAEEVCTVKVEKRLCSSVEEGKNYEFTFKSTKKFGDNISSIFDNSEVVSIIETQKVGLEQIQDSF